jgi:hypothetical protein
MAFPLRLFHAAEGQRNQTTHVARLTTLRCFFADDLPGQQEKKKPHRSKPPMGLVLD